MREHPGVIAVLIDIVDKPGAEPGAGIGDGYAAIWAKAKSDVTSEQYTEFYRSLSGRNDEPALTAHWRRGMHEYTGAGLHPRFASIRSVR